ncbi:MAG: hypothetical protein AMS18_01335 [Gemmatimonas sp. SG8_17]|jgi:hypothetical protein|nr:MAG: hypothetical protein AMS18_01335 [Gemmatimonas sp. SG8_17]
MSAHLKATASLIPAIASLMLGCSESTSPAEGFTVAGTIQNNTQIAIPANARVLVAWVVSSGAPDHSYVFGEGTIDRAAGTFRVQLTDPPPAAALNDGALGVGIVVVTTNAAVSTGDDLEDIPPADLIGAAGWYGVIFVADPAGAEQVRSWAADFDAGYGVGVGEEVPGSFDRFVPTSASGVVLIIDDLANIDFVNWT